MNKDNFIGIWILALSLASFNLTTHASTEAQNVNSLYQLVWENVKTNPDSALYFAKQLKDISTKKKDWDNLVKAHYSIGYIYDELGYFDVAASNYFLALDLINKKSVEESDFKKILLYQCLGVVYQNSFSYDLALNYFYEAIKIAETTKNRNSLAELHYNIGITLKDKKDYDQALTHLQKSQIICESVNDISLQIDNLNAVGVIYEKLHELKKSEAYYFQALALLDKIPTIAMEKEMFLKNNLGKNFMLRNEYALARRYFSESLKLSQQFEDYNRIKRIYNNIGETYYAEGDLQKALYYFQKVIPLTASNAIDEELQHAYKNMSDVHKSLGQYKIALECNSSYIEQTDKIIALKEDLAEQNAQYRMKELDWQRELMQKEVLLASAEKENMWGRIIIGIALILILYSGRLIYTYYSKIRKARKIVNSYSVEHLHL